MKGTEKIIAHIQAEAQAKVDAILAQAEQQCAGIREDYENKAQKTYEDKINSGKKDTEANAGSIYRLAQMEAKKGILGLKQDLVSECFDLACEKILVLPKEDKVAFLAKLVADATVTGNEIIVLSAMDKDEIGDAVKEEANKLVAEKGINAELTVADAAGDFKGGVIVRRGNIEVNCTVELLIDLCRLEMSSEIAGVLFA